jgi:hypothetical protein
MIEYWDCDSDGGGSRTEVCELASGAEEACYRGGCEYG